MELSEKDQPATLAQQQAYYDTRWPKESDRPNRHEMARLSKIFEALFLTKIDFSTQSLRICDLGCGRGWLANMLANFGDVTGVDLSPEGVRVAAQKWPHIKFLAHDITEYRDPEKFDIVVSAEVLEHVPDKEKFFETLSNIMKPGGFVILTTPNQALFARYLKSGVELQPIEDWVSVSELRNLAGNRFEIVKHETFLFDLYYDGIFRIISSPKFIALMESIRLGGFRLWLQKRFKLGLHQIYFARFLG